MSTTITSSKSGIDIVLGGTQGTDWDQEYFFYDQTICDRSVIYIKSATTIELAHNSRNVARNNTDNLPQYDPVIGGNVGVIRYKVDRDMQWGRLWGNASGSENWPVFGGGTQTVTPTDNDTYSAPFTLDSLTYGGGGPAVVGTTGSTGTVTNWDSYYWRGILDSVGDEWHVLTVADWDSFATGTGDEWKCSDGKVFHLVVNPKTPILKVSSTGDAQFYTTPPKIYFIPKIHDQTTYFNAGSGSVSFTLKDINGNNIFWRIGGSGGYTNAGSSTKTFTDADFSTGTNILDYYYAGNAAYTKRRTIVKNPSFPSASETHGLLLYGTTARKDAVALRAPSPPYQDQYERLWDNNLTYLTTWDSTDYQSRKRTTYGSKSIYNSVAASIRGWTSTPTGKSKSSARYALEMLLDNELCIDPVGLEITSNGGATTRELFDRGYYDVDKIFSLAFSYDLIAENFKSTDETGGMTAIEDYFIRDNLASCVMLGLMQSGNWTMQPNGRLGMWGTARNIGALITALAMPAYSTPYYGTSGFDGNTTTYTRTPYPDVGLTWKKVFFDNDATLTGYPNLNFRFGVEDDQWPASSIGDFEDIITYLGPYLMGHVFYILSSTTKANSLGISFPHMEAGFAKMAAGTIVGLQDPLQTYGFPFGSLLIANSLHPTLAPTFIAHGIYNQANTPGNVEAQLYDLYTGTPYSLVYYDYDFEGGSVSDPTFSPVAGAYSGSQSVTLSSLTGGAYIRYTTDGSTPNNSYGNIYDSPVTVSTTTTIKAIAYNGVDGDSNVTSALYEISYPTNPSGAGCGPSDTKRANTARVSADMHRALYTAKPVDRNAQALSWAKSQGHVEKSFQPKRNSVKF